MAQNKFINFIKHPLWYSLAAIATVLAFLFAIFTWAVPNVKTLLSGNTSLTSVPGTSTSSLHSKTPTITGITQTPDTARSPTPTILYQADFSKGDQGWLTYAHSSQWSYNPNYKVLESDGSLYCCSSSTISNIIVLAPYTLATNDYTIQAQIKVTGINKNHSYTESDKDQDPFFGLYVRGDTSKTEGYMAGINGLPLGEPNAQAYSSFLTFGPTVPDGKIFRGKEAGGKDFVLDNNWHTYQLTVKGDAFMLSIDNIPVYTSPVQDSYFSSGPSVGLEDYDFYLQVQNFTVTSL